MGSIFGRVLRAYNQPHTAHAAGIVRNPAVQHTIRRPDQLVCSIAWLIRRTTSRETRDIFTFALFEMDCQLGVLLGNMAANVYELYIAH